MNPNARIDIVHKSWRVRVPGQDAKYFSFRKHGGMGEALRVARAWRNAFWDGKSRREKLTDAQRAEIRESAEPSTALAEKFGIHPEYVNQLRRVRK